MRPRTKVVVFAALAITIVSGAMLASCAFSSSPSSSVHVQQNGVALFVGDWHVHGATMTINGDGSGKQSWNAGPCSGVSSDPNPHMCEGYEDILFTANADGTITGKATKVWYLQWNLTPVPAGYDPGSDSPRVGDLFKLRRINDHLLITTWLNRPDFQGEGNPYWCGSHYSGAECGA